MHLYTAFGLNFHSELELTPLKTAEATNPDVRIVLGPVSHTGLDQPHVTKPFCQTAPNQLWLDVPDIARFQVSDGNMIIVDPKPDADPQSVQLFLLGSCMGAIMYQRNRLVIHGNAIRFRHGCVIVAGASGAGKSTLAAAFVKRGYQVLADDLSVIDDHVRVQPSYPQLKIWRDTAKKLDIDTSPLKRIRMQVDKFAFPLHEQFYSEPLPIKAVYILNPHNQPDLRVEEITGMNKFQPLKNQSYRGGYLEGLGLNAQHLTLCASLANQSRVARIIRPNNGFKINELVELIEDDMTPPLTAAKHD